MLTPSICIFCVRHCVQYATNTREKGYTKLTADAGFNADLVHGTPRVVGEVSADIERVYSSRYQTVDEQSSLVGRDDLRRRLGKYELGIDIGVRLVLFHTVVFDLYARHIAARDFCPWSWPWLEADRNHSFQLRP